MADTTGRIPLWIIGTVTGILVIGLIGIPPLQLVFFHENPKISRRQHRVKKLLFLSRSFP